MSSVLLEVSYRKLFFFKLANASKDSYYVSDNVVGFPGVTLAVSQLNLQKLCNVLLQWISNEPEASSSWMPG